MSEVTNSHDAVVNLGTAAPLLSGRTVALVHEWFGSTGGAENVFRHIAELVPHAARFVLWKDPGVDEPSFRESWLGRTPLRHTKAASLPLMPLVWRTLSRDQFDVVISSSHAFAHTVRLRAAEHTRYLSYVHTPARYLWSPMFDGRGSSPMLALPRRILRAADVRLSRHVHSYAANSREISVRIRRYWHRDAVIIHPPVDVDFFAAMPPGEREPSRDYLLGVGRWIPYKNFDLIIAIADAAGLPLVVAGSGSEEANLRRAASRVNVPVRFEVMPSKERLRQLYRGAKALLFPVHEDFGIIPVEAQAAGTPVLGLRRGGLLETVVDGETGFLVDTLDPRDFVPLIRRLDEIKVERVAEHATRFSPDMFASRLAAWISSAAG